MRAARAETTWTLALALAALTAACGTDVVRLKGHADSPAAKPECVTRPPVASGVVCVYCGADYTMQRACLKCESPTDGSMCVTCEWSDRPDAGLCMQCSDASGKVVSTVGCNELRPDDLYAPGT